MQSMCSTILSAPHDKSVCSGSNHMMPRITAIIRNILDCHFLKKSDAKKDCMYACTSFESNVFDKHAHHVISDRRPW